MSVLAVVAGIVTGVATIAMIAIITKSVDSEDGGLRLALFVGAAVLVLVSGALASNALVRVTQRSTDRLRAKVVDDFLAMPMRSFEKYGSARALAVLTDDLTAVGQAVQSLPLLLINSVVVTCSLIYVGVLSVPALIVLIVAGVLGALAYAWANGRAGVHMRRAREAQDDMQASYAALTLGMKDLKLSRKLRTGVVGDELRSHSSRYADSVVRGSTVSLVTGYWGQMLFLACVGAIVFAGGWLDIQSSDQYAVALAVLYINTPLVTVLNIAPVLTRASVALERILDVGKYGVSDETARTESSDEARAATVPDEPRSVIHDVTLDNVTFRYEGNDETFGVGPVTQSFARGTVTFLIGGNGSGKSTIGKVLAGLYPPESGTLEVDGVALGNRERVEYRERVSACFADSYLFGRLDAGRPEVAQRAKRWLTELALDEHVRLVGDRFEYEGLSTGQSKRLALVEILADPRDVVILDEWAAEQDPELRARFYTEILPELRDDGRIVVVVTHDDRFFHTSDAGVKLERGVHVGTNEAREPVS